MKFMIGPAPIRRTLRYLEAGQLIFKDRVRIMELHYNMFFRKLDRPKRDTHFGLRDFYFWHMGQIQFKNPSVQIVRFLEMTPNPFIRCWLDDGRDVLFDCDEKSKDEIMDQMKKILGKTASQVASDSVFTKSQLGMDNPAIFGFNRKRFCMCVVDGQVPCVGVVDMPIPLRGKYNRSSKHLLEEYEEKLEDTTEKERDRRMRARWPFRVQPEFHYRPDLRHRDK